MAQTKSQYKQEQRKKSISGIINNVNCFIKNVNITYEVLIVLISTYKLSQQNKSIEEMKLKQNR
jgi:hypothetical protein